MKKLLVMVLAAAMLLSLCACGADTSDVTDPSTPSDGNVTPSTTPVGYTFTYEDYQFGVDMDMSIVLEKLGEPNDKEEMNSCAFGGKNVRYYYNSIQITTTDDQGYERIYSIYFDNDLANTEEGICAGNVSSAAQVKAAYGEPSEKSSETCLVYDKDGMFLRFNLDGDKVSTIEYTLLG